MCNICLCLAALKHLKFIVCDSYLKEVWPPLVYTLLTTINNVTPIWLICTLSSLKQIPQKTITFLYYTKVLLAYRPIFRGTFDCAISIAHECNPMFASSAVQLRLFCLVEFTDCSVLLSILSTASTQPRVINN